MFRRHGLMIAVLAVAATLGCYNILSAQVGEAARDPGERTFAKRFVVITSEGPVQLLMEEPQVRRLGERTFLVGRHAGNGTENNPFEGAIGWVPIEKVITLLEFDTVEAARKAY